MLLLIVLFIIFLLCSTLGDTLQIKSNFILPLTQKICIYSLIFKLNLPEFTVAWDFHFISVSILCNQDISRILSSLALKTT